jgi:cyclopropane-fatty-acyl-phospholipid synthase
MARSSAKQKVQDLLASADIGTDGKRPWDILVRDERFYDRFLAQGTLGLGEAYMDGWWDCPRLDEAFTRAMSADLESHVRKQFGGLWWYALKARFLNRQSIRRSKKVAHEHYDIGNDLYTRMLDKNMQYTCGYFQDAVTLDQAQERKLDLVARKLKLAPGMTVLELGGGFGGLAHWLASRYGCTVTSYNISREQLAYARAWCKDLPVTFIEADYRTATGSFDHVVSIGLAEHVGYKNYRTLMETAHRCLKPGGYFLLHTIGSNRSLTATDPWIDRYIFPGGVIPSIAQLGRAAEKLFVMEDWHNFGPDYDTTCMAWFHNFDTAWPELKATYGERFYRMWKYYLLLSAAAFRSRQNQLWQIVYSKGIPAKYTAER